MVHQKGDSKNQMAETNIQASTSLRAEDNVTCLVELLISTIIRFSQESLLNRTVLAELGSRLGEIRATLDPKVPDDPILRKYCPACEPDHDESERYAYPQYCSNHQRSNSDGELDRLVDSTAYLSGTGEAGGKDNILWCNFLHRNREKEIKIERKRSEDSKKR